MGKVFCAVALRVHSVKMSGIRNLYMSDGTSDVNALAISEQDLLS